MDKYLIAHDLGTSSNKASLFSTEGRLIKSYTVPYDVRFFQKNCAEQNPLDWWNAVCTATRKIVDGICPEDVLSLSFSSQMQACVIVDRQGNALRPAMIWADLRAEEQARQLIERVGAERMYELNGHRASASYSIEKLMWIRDNEPELYGRTYKMLLAKDYIICRLTGNFVTDHSEASGTDAFDLRNRRWSEEILSAAEIEMEKMPELNASTDVVGQLLPEAAQALGLKKETRVVCGGGDGPCSALGAGSIEKGQMFLSFGTSAWIAGTSEEVFLDKEKTLICFGHVIPGKYMPCGTMQAAGSSYSYIRKTLCREEERRAQDEGIPVYDILNRLVTDSPAGARGLVFLPYMLGERSPRWNPDTSGSFLGIKMEHEKCDYIRAVLEGVAMNLDLILKAHREYTHVEELVLTGGGAKGDVLAQILSDVLGVALRRLDYVETATSVAAAVIAGVGVGVFEDFSVIHQFVKPERSFYPDRNNRDVYARQKALFEEGYNCLRSYYELETGFGKQSTK
ncbi:xylulokinase [[Clostridium] hylemonae]|uniref:Xylulose kinase n=2 Tax=[Clostridium] hylemonae TaxID=89153 RepID=C0C0P3_9FIRM|nr:xylulokinase [[Clostridium] hylemonae]EEG74380.1 carbohydrate kinase, FGGY family protein [[Clostridium] hylemonae DSM 15053]QEK19035.1 Xylulose kinase [[Clostridium] hylemonae DSM 15053]